MWPVALSALCAAALCALLVGERLRSTRLVYSTKPLASLAFILVAVAGGGIGEEASPYAAWVIIGLVLGAGGDVALMLPGKRAFAVGLGLFLFGHIAYIVACAEVVEPSRWLSVHACVPAFAALAALAYLWPHLGSMTAPVITYVFTITLMVVAAHSTLRVGAHDQLLLGDRQAYLLTFGALLFFVSDLFVARDRFVEGGFVNRAVGLPAYYTGQLLFAWSTIA